MMALLLKDLALLKQQKQFFLVMAGLVVFYSFFSSGTAFTFAIVYMGIMMGMFTLSTISYDEYNNGTVFLFTLPISRREYVLEKYVFAAIMSACSTVVATAFCLGAGYAKGMFANGADVVEFFAGGIGGALVTVCLMLSLMIPLQLKFGSEKSRIVWIGCTLGFVAVAVGGTKLMRLLNVDVGSLLDKAGQVSPVTVIVVLAVLLVGMILISCRVSMGIMEKREF